MKEITAETFFEQINKESTFDGYTFNLNNLNFSINDTNLKNETLYFLNCTINCSQLSFENINNANLLLSFENCKINCDLNIFNCKIKTLSFIDIIELKSLDIDSGIGNNCEFEIFQFFNRSPKKLKSDIYISNSIFKNGNLRIEKIIHIQGSFIFRDNTILKREFETYHHSTFDDSSFSFATFSNNRFENSVSFKNAFFFNNNIFDRHKNETETNPNVSFFIYNNFNNVSFTNCNFIQFSQFLSCTFNGITDFNNSKNDKNGVLLFSECNFNGITYFNNCNLNVLTFTKCSFDKITSFNQSSMNKLFFIQVKFDKMASFDYIKIKILLDHSFLKSDQVDIWKITLRTIKQELQKTENRIDFNRFKNHEMATYYKELSWKHHSVDKSILWATKWSTDFGNSWARGLIFTLLSGLIFFSLFYTLENYKYSFNLTNWQDFGKGYIRFFLITDFYNPLEKDKTYIETFWSWIPFIFGKIFIAFGIYEMIQAFRKFKA